MSAYVVGILTETRLNDDIRRYLDRIDSTLLPYAGRFLIHGGPYLWKEGEPAGDLIVIEFENLDLASRWYDSPAYRAIKSLRMANCVGTVFLVGGVPMGHRAWDILG
ncbi:DUF1330 domain-containing protein [Pusillimonas sp. ANT_WB101]|uniref:DUF1330 domain-containing protein n=1 Tax=Pusillimonas sp. ANT_WB101 TaxID=2597356 RepID=UPI0011EEE7F0|nr:DUF1330 domain-containing protein [Pusillimonas sp. ANT_WB101]KAA0893103.1 DUF1330 domain-containing protein [Pusillimonas sp. ANT_WB101]